MQAKIGFLALYPELATKVRHVAREVAGTATVTVWEETSPLADATLIQAAKKLEADCDVLIARGGMQPMVAPEVSVPVIECPITFPDILNALYQARDKGEKILLILHHSQDHDLGPWPGVLGIKVMKVLCNHRQEIYNKVRNIWEEGVVVVGGTLAVEAAKQLGMPSHLIIFSDKTILQSLQKAIEIVKATHKEKERAARLQALLDFAHEGIIFLEGNNAVAHVNSAATEILKIPREQLMGRKITEVLKTSSDSLEAILNGQVDSPLTGKLLKLDSLSIMANIVPVRVGTQTAGTVVTFFEAARLRNLEHNFRRQLARRAMTARFTLDDIIGRSKAIAAVKQQAAVFAATDSTVAIYGESGVGKELFAQSIHNLSSRKNGPFVAINCSALPKELMESELFGYEEGAFTGAKKGGKEGLFELAHGGTLFLDEIGTMPLELQSKILRVLQEKEVTRLGGNSLIPVDVRIIVATNRDLKEAVRQGEFRQDLYFRLNVLPLYIPPLRERPEDIPLLFEHFARTFSRRLGRRLNLDNLHNVHLLQEYYWPGNVRELVNFCERFVALAGQQGDQDELLKQLLQESRQEFNPGHGLNLLEKGRWKETWQELEKNLLEQVLAESGMTKTALARSLGIDRTTLWKKLKKSKGGGA
ncbi:Anaerobic nitric oxide reductase transcription regulator NorR [Neomoorella glycerini]|uniref:Anaerobic nitric oxide reductase transcription regulator NorR n=1 Tax=Neomoorella glycerini TaxID=55779 RepID=A0A6I5ZU13_9FIRM|nr:sigma 54-interacting transcriptional regulator [Moorella glycerini]QGP93159.1 Anaerobic nitric oxide reductase transcription regulator NorR [Moorella glycerini]